MHRAPIDGERRRSGDGGMPSGLVVLDGDGELVAAARDGANVVAVRVECRQGLAQAVDRLRQARIGDRGVAPRVVDDLVLRDHAAVGAREHGEQLELLRGDPDGVAAEGEDAALAVECEPAEGQMGISQMRCYDM